VYTKAGLTDKVNSVFDVPMDVPMVQQCTAYLLEHLKGDRPEDGALQTRLLEMNLMAAPQVCRGIPMRT
jgi:clathrin heavy chain